jgi:hypothetical protein
MGETGQQGIMSLMTTVLERIEAMYTLHLPVYAAELLKVHEDLAISMFKLHDFAPKAEDFITSLKEQFPIQRHAQIDEASPHLKPLLRKFSNRKREYLWTEMRRLLFGKRVGMDQTIDWFLGAMEMSPSLEGACKIFVGLVLIVPLRRGVSPLVEAARQFKLAYTNESQEILEGIDFDAIYEETMAQMIQRSYPDIVL